MLATPERGPKPERRAERRGLYAGGMGGRAPPCFYVRGLKK
jgi:hypothetical protein